MINTLYLIIPCLALAIIVVILEMLTPLFKKNRIKEIIKGERYWLNIINKCQEDNNYILDKKGINRFVIPSYLIAFENIFKDNNLEVCKNIFICNSKSICEAFIKSQDNALCGFFASLLSNLDLTNIEDEVKSDYANLLFSFAKRKSVYCHENALKAFYVFGDISYIIKIFAYYSSNSILHNEKLLTDGLLSFTGNKNELAKALIANKGNLDIHYQTAIVNFLTFANIHLYDSTLIKELTKELNVDYKCAIIRLISKMESDINRTLLLSILKDYSFSINWQPAAVAANGLIHYVNDEEVMSALAKSVHSQHWSVRINSANALVKIDQHQTHVIKVLGDDDNFAHDAIHYALEAEIKEDI